MRGKSKSGSKSRRLLPPLLVLLLVLATFLLLFRIGTLSYLGSPIAWHIALFLVLVLIALQVGALTLFAKLLPKVFIPISAVAILFGLYKLATVRIPWEAEPLNSLIGTMKFTKGIEYLIAISFLLAFIGFWQLMQRRGRELFVRIVPVTVLVLGFGALAYSCISSQAVATLTPSASLAEFRLAPVLEDTYGPAKFDHKLHQQVLPGNNCTTCHHYSSKYEFPSCSKCHTVAPDLEHPERPRLVQAYHLRCIGCHRESGAGPTDCTGCHARAERPPAAIPHALELGDCLKCHQAGAGQLGMPEDHADATSGTCTLCHTGGGSR